VVFYFIFIITKWDPLVLYKSFSRCVSLLVLGVRKAAVIIEKKSDKLVHNK